ncbi:hypothetical protein NGA_0556900 [Nannochloropsis gaditana CCMP526]|uniref:uncharacterized protein n=1 Tax=Nannochloropsis gaditana (strain CCMP526) TaxID=1093141 RepID=UPI00029F703E|nr:hypothetical protein NGA_0556900 [Nannochloropsis gaditana CCMP526]EKU20466.1 hypothetical protein NGA_0556900 [Nannochloropsis gaditana CCMP526]|eukprot:XP_005855890.1 hypothetical protein NGA_0556900 [Nannochloropsis gaditana CCMP526]
MSACTPAPFFIFSSLFSASFNADPFSPPPSNGAEEKTANGYKESTTAASIFMATSALAYSIVFAFIFEICLLHQRVDALAFGGGAAIIVGCVVSVRSQNILTGRDKERSAADATRAPVASILLALPSWRPLDAET